ncbi:hypothetical protein ACFPYI_13635 [Halomarina salina]|uniref:Lipoprotein n=1 Tax=Halomarina salina TaxID=1872699 RepID=A0ABD5RPR4_9EURY|nr:hypothetical protein [Halomarina salina]
MELARGATVLLCLLTVLAGCSSVPGLGGGGDDTYGEGESLNTSALAADHASNLREAGSFTVVLTQNSSTGEGATTDQRQRVAVDLDANRTLLTGSADQRSGNRSVSNEQTVYGTDEATFVRIGQGEDARYQYIDASGGGPMTPSLGGEQFVPLNATSSLATATDWTRNGTTTQDGETLTRFVATGNETLADSVFASSGVTVTRYDATLLVTNDGTVRQSSFTLGVESGGQSATQRVDVRITDVGNTTVEEPDWLDEAREQSGGLGNGTTDGAESGAAGVSANGTATANASA